MVPEGACWMATVGSLAPGTAPEVWPVGRYIFDGPRKIGPPTAAVRLWPEDADDVAAVGSLVPCLP